MSPAVGGKRRCRMPGGAGRARRGNQNALEHGLFTKLAIEEPRQFQALRRPSRKLLQDIGWCEGADPGATVWTRLRSADERLRTARPADSSEERQFCVAIVSIVSTALAIFPVYFV